MSRKRLRAIYLDEGIATTMAWAKLRGLVVRDVVPYGSEPGFPKYVEKYQIRFYYRISDLDEYFANKPDVTGTTMDKAKKMTDNFLTTLRNTNALWGQE